MSARRSAIHARPRLRCAIYTRKSSEEGLDQDFNSLHAQRQACEAYVASQAGEGWSALATAYDDGGFSGGSMERPGLQRLLNDIDARRIDIVLVYKVDRLTRSLADFAKIVERFDGSGASFVSVTQAFNTTTSMGRLTLNVLLSFAQFEREVTSERIRDKIAASKAKGMWMGGSVPLGYDHVDRKLVVNEPEAERVRHIFDRYLALGSVHALRDELEARGYRSKRRLTRAGQQIGGGVLGRGQLFHILSNRVYVGEITHKTQSYPGQHRAILPVETFDEVQRNLAQNAGPARRAKVGLAPLTPKAPLARLVFDDAGNRMTHLACRKGEGRLYRYYVSMALQEGRKGDAGTLPRASAPALEAIVQDRLDRLGLDLTVVARVEVGRREVKLRLLLDDIEIQPHRLPSTDQVITNESETVIAIAATMKWRGGAKSAIGPAGVAAVDTKRIDVPLLRALVRAETWRRTLEQRGGSLHALADSQSVHRAYAQRVVRLAWLSPDLKRAVLDGEAPAGLTLTRLIQQDIPLAWSDQARWARG